MSTLFPVNGRHVGLNRSNQWIASCWCDLDGLPSFPLLNFGGGEPLTALLCAHKDDLLPIWQLQPIIWHPSLPPTRFVSPELHSAEKQYALIGSERWQLCSGFGNQRNKCTYVLKSHLHALVFTMSTRQLNSIKTKKKQCWCLMCPVCPAERNWWLHE